MLTKHLVTKFDHLNRFLQGFNRARRLDEFWLASKEFELLFRETTGEKLFRSGLGGIHKRGCFLGIGRRRLI